MLRALISKKLYRRIQAVLPLIFYRCHTRSEMDNLKKSSKYKHMLILCVAVTLSGIILLGYLCTEQVCAFNGWTYSQSRYESLSKFNPHRVVADNMGKPVSFLSHPLNSNSRSLKSRNKLSFEDLLEEENFEFDIKGSDVMVFLHIQKTGGTIFGRHLVSDLDLERPCSCKRGRKKCKCFRPDSKDKFWLFSRYSTGWKCGLHADWTELTNCVDSAMDQTERESSKRRYYYITLLRDPVSRFLSEYRHVQRGATWKTAKHTCGGRSPTKQELPPCFTGEDWRDVTLEEFMGCTSNLAVNRQTRMLADLNLVGCYNTSLMPRRERDIMMLASAKLNLQKMAFFGLCEYQKVSQYLFESTFHLHFLQPFDQLNETHSSLTLNEISADDLLRIQKLNKLDLELYEFAKALLFKRFNLLKELDPNFEYSFKNLGRKRNHLDEMFGSDFSQS